MDEDEKIEDKTSKNEDEDKIVDDLDDAFGDDEDETVKDKEGDEDKSKSKDKDEDKDKDKKPSKKSSAVYQKQKFREKLKEATDEIKRLKEKSEKSDLTADEKKEKQAQEYLAKAIRDEIKRIKDEESEKNSEAEEALQEELDAVLEEHTDLSEKQVLDVCEELEVSPRQAVKIIERERKFKGKEKPKIPQAKRGSPEVDEDKEKDKKGKIPTFDEINRAIKAKLKKGEL